MYARKSSRKLASFHEIICVKQSNSLQNMQERETKTKKKKKYEIKINLHIRIVFHMQWSFSCCILFRHFIFLLALLFQNSVKFHDKLTFSSMHEIE